MSAPLLPLLAYAEEAHNELPMPPLVFALIAFGLFLFALGVLWSFRNTAAKIASKQPGSSHPSGPSAGQGGQTGPGHH